MSYDLYNENGYVGPGPCINGLRQLKQATKSKSTIKYPTIAHLLKHGYAPSPILLKGEAMGLSREVTDKGVKATLLEIGKAASKSNDIVILK